MQVDELAKHLQGDWETIQLDGNNHSSSKTLQQLKSEHETPKREMEDPVMEDRRNQVKAAMLHAWSSYVKYAWGFDELQVYLWAWKGDQKERESIDWSTCSIYIMFGLVYADLRNIHAAACAMHSKEIKQSILILLKWLPLLLGCWSSSCIMYHLIISVNWHNAASIKAGF